MVEREPLINQILVELKQRGLTCSTKGRSITIGLNIEGTDLKIRADIPVNFPLSLPDFHLLNRLEMGGLAHISWNESKPEYGDICYTHKTAVNINTEDALKVFINAFEAAYDTLKESLTNPHHNEAEIYREYMSVWLFGSDKEKPLLSIVDPKDSDYVFFNVHKATDNAYLATSTNTSVNPEHQLLKRFNKNSQPVGKGILISIPKLIPPLRPKEDVMSWWSTQLNNIPTELLAKIQQKYAQLKARNCWIILHTRYQDNPFYIGLRFKPVPEFNKVALPLPVFIGSLHKWQVQAARVVPVVPEVLIPRGGGSSNWQDKNICVVGCGSVGSKVIDLFCSQGVGRLTVIDHDRFELENLHKHHLPAHYLEINKAFGMKATMNNKYPFVLIEAHNHNFNGLDFDKEIKWSKYDLVVWATGSTPLEMAFDRYRIESGLKVPVIYAWNEPFGVGGHAVATLPDHQGCLACTYIDKETLSPSLYSNLAFLANGQRTMSDIGGCGYDYIAFSNTDATQTAIVVSRMAEKLFNQQISEPVVVSWKGDDYLAQQRGLKLTRRYNKFEGGMKEVVIAQQDCHVCN